MLGGVLLLCGCQTARTNVSFQRHELVTEPSKRQTILTGWFLGEGAIADLGVINVDHQGKRRLRIYAVNDIAGAPKLSVTLRPSVLFVDVADIGGRDRLIIYERGRLSWFDPRSRTESLLVKVNSNFRRPREREIPHVDLTRDANGDGMDDLINLTSNDYNALCNAPEMIARAKKTLDERGYGMASAPLMSG